jgi:hypothetical protein
MKFEAVWLDTTGPAGLQASNGSLRFTPLRERLNSGGLVLYHVEHRVDHCEAKNVLHSFDGIGQLQNPAVASHGGTATEQFANARTVYVGHVAEIQQYVLMAMLDEVTNQFMKRHTAPGTNGIHLTKNDSSPKVDDCNSSGMPNVTRNAHGKLLSGKHGGIACQRLGRDAGT